MRIVAVWCPDWSACAAGLEPDIPAAVLYANRVIARTRAAATMGVQRGQRRREAQRICPALCIVDHDPDRDARRFEPLVRAVSEIAPRLEVITPGRLQLAARGPSRYFGGDHAFAERLIELIVEIEPTASRGVGVADGQIAAAVAAQLAARTESGVRIVAAGESTSFLAPLPVEWLMHLGEASGELVDLFKRLGLQRFGDLAALSVADVVARFGATGLLAHRIANADDPRPLSSAGPPVDRVTDHHFDHPAELLDSVIFVGKRLADQLCASLAREGMVCVRIEVTIESEHGDRSQRLWYRDQGLSAQAMVERIRWQLDGWVGQHSRSANADDASADGIIGGVTLLRLDPIDVRPDDGVQGGIWGGRSKADDDAARAIVRLSGIAGNTAVRVPEWLGGRLPAERYRWVPADGVDLEEASVRLDRGDAPWPGSLRLAPAVVLQQPIPVELVDGSGKRLMVNGRGLLSGEPARMRFPSDGSDVVRPVERQVSAWAGPWPVEQRWWDSQRSRRLARLQLVTEGGDAWLVGVEQGRWGVLAHYR